MMLMDSTACHLSILSKKAINTKVKEVEIFFDDISIEARERYIFVRISKSVRVDH